MNTPRDAEVELLNELRRCVRNAGDAPPQLLFWVSNVRLSAEELWLACPRREWLAFIALACGYPRADVLACERVVSDLAEQKGERWTRHSDPASAFRELVSFPTFVARARFLVGRRPEPMRAPL